MAEVTGIIYINIVLLHSVISLAVRLVSVLARTTSDRDRCLLLNAKKVFLLHYCSAVRGVYSMLRLSQCLFVNREGLLCPRKAEKNSYTLAQIEFHTRSWLNVHTQWLSLSSASTGAWKKKRPLQAEQRRVS